MVVHVNKDFSPVALHQMLASIPGRSASSTQLDPAKGKKKKAESHDLPANAVCVCVCVCVCVRV